MLTDELKRGVETAWRNPGVLPVSRAVESCPLGMEDIREASDRLARFAPFFVKAFPETSVTGGIIESPLQKIPAMQARLEEENGISLGGDLWIKLDSHLPISGSIKARGGIYEVLKLAEDIALREGGLQLSDDYSILCTDRYRSLFSEYAVAVGSTGNLGLSIGIISARLGFKVTVHMSADARQWKKNMLRSKGVRVVEYPSDYSEAVRRGRLEAQSDPKCHFVDDENSKTLFLGYSVAALRLKEQMQKVSICVDQDHPLMVYLPCGVGGGPGGVAFGLRMVFGDYVHCFFAEPTQAPCMILGMSTGLHNGISIQDIGIEGITAADGLAVGRASGFVGKVMEPFLDGCYTLTDRRMYRMLAQLADSEDIWLEPSALAGMYGPVVVQNHPEFSRLRVASGATHLVWATGGSMVPQAEKEKYYQKGMRKVCI